MKIRKYAETYFNFKYLIFISTILFLAITATALITVYQNAKIMSKFISDDFNKQQLIIARQIASQIYNILHDIEIEIESFNYIDFMRYENLHRNAMKHIIARYRSNGIIDVGLLNNKDRYKEVCQDCAIYNLLPRHVLTDFQNENPDTLIMQPPRVVTDENGISVVTVLFYKNIFINANKRNVVYARFNVTQIVWSIAHNITSGKTGYTWLIDEAGEFLYHPEEEFVGKNAFQVRKERRPLISFTQINQIMKDKMLQGEEGTGTYISGWHRGTEGTIEKLVAFTPVKSPVLLKGHTWSVAVAAPVSEVAETVHMIYQRHMLTEFMLFVGLFLFGVLAVVYHQRMSKSLKERVKETEANLHHTEQFYQKIVDKATDLIYVFDLEGRIVLLNHKALEVFSNLALMVSEGGEVPDNSDISRPEWWISRKMRGIFSSDDAAFLERQFNAVIEKSTSITYRHKLQIDNRSIYLSTNLVPLRNDNGEIIQFLGISRDVTERMELDHRIYHMEKLASIGTLAAGVAHEINNPLAIILGFTDLLVEKFQKDSQERKDLEMVIEQGTNAKKVVENLLGFARVTEGLEDTVEIYESINKVLNVVKNTLLTKKIEIVNKILPDLPPVRCDAREYQQVIFNLVNNAIAAMDDAGGTLILSSKMVNNFVHVTVSDTGAGIPDRIKPHIFDPFFTTKNVGEGTGLGLSLCYGIVKKYGGNISFTSVSQENHSGKVSGSAFTVSLPVSAP